jgi:hypothetical protein
VAVEAWRTRPARTHTAQERSAQEVKRAEA